MSGEQHYYSASPSLPYSALLFLSLSFSSTQYRNYIMWIMCYFGRTTKKVYWSDKRKDNFLEDANLESMKVQKQAAKKQLQTTENQVNQWKPGRKWMMLTLFIMFFPFPSAKKVSICFRHFLRNFSLERFLWFLWLDQIPL